MNLKYVSAALAGFGMFLVFGMGIFGLGSCNAYTSVDECDQGKQIFKFGFAFGFVLLFGGGISFAVFTVQQNPFNQKVSVEAENYYKQNNMWCDILNCPKSDCLYCYNGIEHKRSAI